MSDLSIIIPARNETFLQRTIEDIFENTELDTEIIAILDGYWPDPVVYDHPKLTVVHLTKPIGQRAAVNLGARISQSKYIMKADAHCAFGKGFDRILVEDCEPNWTMTPRMWNLHAFDWECINCGFRSYQGVEPDKCLKCGDGEDAIDDGTIPVSSDRQYFGFRKVMVWKPRGNKVTVSWRFDELMHFQYWKDHRKRPENQGDLIETMSIIGCLFMMERERFWKIGGLDEAHGSWGQFGTEIACKTWLSGGQLITSKKTWFGHMFRTGNFKGSGYGGRGTFPYPLANKEQTKSKAYSKDLWLNDKWDRAIHPLSWLVDKFAPVPGWHEEKK